MNICRTCLKTPAEKDIALLEKGIKDDSIDIMAFCLDIKITQDSKTTTNLCNICYRKIISFYKFKKLSLKNDAYLKTLDLSVFRKNQINSVYVDEFEVKHESDFETDECAQSFVEDCSMNIKIEHVKTEYSEDIEIEVDETICQVDTKEQVVLESQEKPFNVVVKKVQPSDMANITKQQKKCEKNGSSVLDLQAQKPKKEKRMLKCKACFKEFAFQSHLKRHFKIRHLGLKSKCDICNKEVINVSNHKSYKHNEAKMFPCVTCERRYASQPILDKHMLTHTKQLVLECDLCHKKFRTKSSISQHIRHTHMREINFQCEFCAKPFYSKSCLQEHLSVHATERPFQCSECGKSFKSKIRLKKHSIAHSDVKNFHCQYCDMSFKLNGYLQTHLVKHTQEKRYPCRFCDKRFGRSGHRFRHEKNLHQNLLTMGDGLNTSS